MFCYSVASIRADGVVFPCAPRRTARVSLRGAWGTRLRVARLVIATLSPLRYENLCIMRASYVFRVKVSGVVCGSGRDGSRKAGKTPGEHSRMTHSRIV